MRVQRRAAGTTEGGFLETGKFMRRLTSKSKKKKQGVKIRRKFSVICRYLGGERNEGKSAGCQEGRREWNSRALNNSRTGGERDQTLRCDVRK